MAPRTVDNPPPSPPPSNRIVAGPLRPVMLGLVWPVLAEQFLNTLVALVDTYLAGNLPEQRIAATSAVGLAAYVGWLVTMLFALVGTGTTALVARTYGGNDRPQGNHIANQSIMLASAMGIVGAVGMFALAPHFARWLEMSGDTYDIAVDYLRIDALGYAIWALGLVGGAALRGAGDMRTPLKVLAIVNVCNVILSPALVNGWGPAPELGVTGIVIGTLCARVAGGLLVLLVLLRGRHGLKLHVALLRPALGHLVRILRIGGPAAIDGAVLWSGHFLFLKIVGHLGGDGDANPAFAAQIVVVRLSAFTYLPASAWSAACATMIGQALGARLPERAKRCGHEGALQCGLLTAFVGAGFVLFALPLCSLLNKDVSVLAIAVPVLTLTGFFQPLLAAAIVYLGSLRGAGDTIYPMAISAVALATVRVPFGYLIGIVLGGGLLGAWYAVVADMVLRFLLGFVRFTRGRWTTKQI